MGRTLEFVDVVSMLKSYEIQNRLVKIEVSGKGLFASSSKGKGKSKDRKGNGDHQKGKSKEKSARCHFCKEPGHFLKKCKKTQSIYERREEGNQLGKSGSFRSWCFHCVFVRNPILKWVDIGFGLLLSHDPKQGVVRDIWASQWWFYSDVKQCIMQDGWDRNREDKNVLWWYQNSYKGEIFTTIAEESLFGALDSLGCQNGVEGGVLKVTKGQWWWWKGRSSATCTSCLETQSLEEHLR